MCVAVLPPPGDPPFGCVLSSKLGKGAAPQVEGGVSRE